MTYEERLGKCESCPLAKKTTYGLICDSSKWMNLVTEEVSRLPHSGWIRGCGCNQTVKARNVSAKCKAGK